MTINFKDWQTSLQESLKGKQHKLDKNKNGKLDSQDFKMLRKEDIDTMNDAQLDEAINEVLGKDAPAGKWISDFVHSDNPKFSGKSKEKRKQMALAAYYAKQRNEEAEMDFGFSLDEEIEEVEEGCGMKKKKTFREFVEALNEIEFDKSGRYVHKGGSYGTEYYKKEKEKDERGDMDDGDDKPSKPAGEKRGRGRPKGSTSGARQKGSSSGKSYGGIPVHSLNLPNSNK